MTDDEFRRLVGNYLDTKAPDTANAELDMAEGCNGYGADHAMDKHGVTADEILQVVFELPCCDEKRSKHDPARTVLWGCTRSGREIAVVVRDKPEGNKRRLTLITAFDETEDQWRRR